MALLQEMTFNIKKRFFFMYKYYYKKCLTPTFISFG